MIDLAITARCQAELESLRDSAIGVHIIETFVARRSQNPEGGETMSDVPNVRKLHADLSGGRSVRAVTSYDRRREVCWLLAGGTHDRFYEHVVELHKAGTLWPTTIDWANFEADEEIRLIERIVRGSRAALAEALRNPGTEILVTSTPPPDAYFLVRGSSLTVRVIRYVRKRPVIDERGIAAIWGAIFGNAVLNEVFPANGDWASVYLEGPMPDLNRWPPQRTL